MGTPAAGEVTGLLLAWRRGDQSALNRLVPLVYPELRRLATGAWARKRLSLVSRPRVNETYLRLADAAQVSWQDRVTLQSNLSPDHAPGPGRFRPSARIAETGRGRPDAVRRGFSYGPRYLRGSAPAE
jgi:ECF sigma factor